MGLRASKTKEAAAGGNSEQQQEATASETEDGAKEPEWATSGEPAVPKLKVKENE